jgi:hypothetical protein
MHMALAERLIVDPVLPGPVRDLLRTAWGAFLLGSIAPDARVSSGISRVETHFFEYGPVIDPPPAAWMLAIHPGLRRTAIQDSTRAAFVAGYVAHLAMDEVWCTDLLFPDFVQNEWGPQAARHLALHVLLGHLDERDRLKLPSNHYSHLASARPNRWLPFMSDVALTGWRDLIAAQIAPGAASQTLDILGKRIGKAGSELAAMVNSEVGELVWSNVPLAHVTAVEEAMYVATRAAIIAYFESAL